MTRQLRFPSFFFFNDTATTEIYTLSLHDALPISERFASFGTCDRVVQQTGTIPRERQVEDHVRPIWVKLCCLCQFLHCFGGLAVVDQYLSEALSKLAFLFWRQRC